MCGRRVHHYAVYNVRETVGGEADTVCQEALHQVFRDIDGGFCPVTDDAYFACIGNLAQHITVITFERNTVGRKEDITVLETYRFGSLVEFHTKRGFLYLYILVAPCKKNHGVDEQCQQEVEQYATHHD